MPQRQWSRDQTDALIDSAELHSPRHESGAISAHIGYERADRGSVVD